MTTPLTARRLRYDTAEELSEDFFRRGWTDGLPVTAPTADLVARHLAAVGLEPDQEIGRVPTRDVVVTAEHVAINSVMAGCLPEYMPVVVAAVRAHLQERGNSHSTTASLGGPSQAVILNGPVRTALGVGCGGGCFGPGWRPNATIGRALRLVIRNVCRAVPGGLDRASFSTPERYTFCFGEDEENSAWVPLHVELGFAPDQSTVTVHSTLFRLPVQEFECRSPESVAEAVITAIRRQGTTGDAWLGDGLGIVLVVGPDHRRVYDAAGWSKADIRSYVWPRLQGPFSSSERPVQIGSPDGVVVVAAGGPGMPETHVLFPHNAYVLTEPVAAPVPAGRQE
jgi:hypothetical protein